MRNYLLAAVAAVSLMLLPSCGALSAFGRAAQDSGALQQRADELEGKMELLDQTLKAYGPLAEDLGPEIKEKYDELLAEYGKVQGYVAEGKELLGEAVSLHQQSLAKATDPDTGETDWMQYALLMLLGGGGVYQDRKNKKGNQRVHERTDKRKGEIAALEEKLRTLAHSMQVEAARREQPPA